MFGGDWLQSAWSKASQEAKDACGEIADTAKAVKEEAAALAQKAEQVTEAAVHKTADAIVHGGKVAGANVFAAGMATGLSAQTGVKKLYSKLDKFARRELGLPAKPCPVMESSKRLQGALDADKKLMDALPPNDPRAQAAQQHYQLGQRALMAQDAYNDSDHAMDIPGVHRLSDAEIQSKLGLDPEMFHPFDSEFRAVIYQDDSVPPKNIVAFKGTTMTSYSDWLNNAQQGLGIESDYYKRAQQLAIKVKQSSPDGMEVVGHSLGGGLAQAAAAATGVKGTTFNAAGLNPATVPGADLNALANNMTNYQVNGEVLTHLQNSYPISKAIGTAVPLEAPPGVTDSVDLHGMDSVDASLVKAAPAW
jgi:hypothetical protein